MPGAMPATPPADIAKWRQQDWPVIDYSLSGLKKEPYSNPSEWWRWATIFMYPMDQSLQGPIPLSPNAGTMALIFGGYQLFRHKKTVLKVLAVDDLQGKPFSPVASLLIQDTYWGRRMWKGKPIPGPPPMTGATQGKSVCNENWSYARPPDWKWDQAGHTTSYQGGYVWPSIWKNPGTNTVLYSSMCFPSFLTLTAWGASWTFPPSQKGFQKGSFSRHSMIGTNDPQGERWLNLLPRNIENPPGDLGPLKAEGSQIDKIIGQLFLAQGATYTGHWRFGTATERLDGGKDNILVNRTWAVVKIWSEWQLGNTRKPYPWDVNWFVHMKVPTWS